MPSGNAVRRLAATFSGGGFAPMGPGQAGAMAPPPASGPAQGAQAAAYGGPSTGQTNYRNLLAQSLIGQGLSGEPVQGPTGALAKLAQVFAGMRIQDKAETATKERGTAFNTAMQAAGNDQAAMQAVVGQFYPEKAAELAIAMIGQKPQEQWEPGTRDGRPGQESTTTGLFNFDPPAPQPPEWQSPGARAYETEKDERDYRQSLGLAAAGQKPDETWKVDTDPDTGVKILRSSLGNVKEYAGNAAVPKPGDVDPMRNSFLNVTEGFRKTDVSYQTILAAAQTPSAAGDLSIIYSYVKMNDPTSNVMPGEMLTVQNAGGLDAQLRQQLNNWLQQGRLPDDKRADLVATAGEIYAVQKNQYDQIRTQFEVSAKTQNLDPGSITIGPAGLPAGVGNDPLGIR